MDGFRRLSEIEGVKMSTAVCCAKANGHGPFHISPRLKFEELFLHEAPSKATNRGESTVSSSINPTANIVPTFLNLSIKALAIRLLAELNEASRLFFSCPRFTCYITSEKSLS